MKVSIRTTSGTAVAALIIGLVPATIRAEVTRVEISSRQDVLGGKAFGSVGSYEKLTGKVYFAVSPENARNKIIADLDKAPRNAAGEVEFSADFYVIRPKTNRAPEEYGSMPYWMLVLAGLGIQGVVGYTQYFNHLPAGLVWVHVASSVVLWIFVLRLYLATRERTPFPAEQAAVPAAPAAPAAPAEGSTVSA